ncbi:MAG: WD40 repeat domain-containing protein [Gemmataceae bacterium]
MRFQLRTYLLWVVLAFPATHYSAVAQPQIPNIPPPPGIGPIGPGGPYYPQPGGGGRLSNSTLSPTALPKEALGRLGSVEFRLDQYVQRMIPSGDGKTVAVTTNSGTAIIEVATGKQIRRIPVNTSSYGSALSPDGKKLAVGGYNQVQIYDTKTGRRIRYFRPAVRTSSSWSTVEFSPDNKLLLAAPGRYNRGNTIYVWNVTDGKSVGTLQVMQDYQPRGIFSPDGKIILSWGTYQNRPTQPPVTLQLWDVSTSKEIRRIETDSTVLNTVAFSPDGEELALINGSSTLSLYDVKTGKLKRRFAGRRGLGTFLKYSADGRYLAAAGNNGDVQIWDRKKQTRVRTKPGPLCFQTGVMFRKDGKILGYGRNQQVLCVWDVLTGKVFTPLSGHYHTVSALAFGSKGRTLRSVDQYGYVCSWDVKSRKPLRRQRVDFDSAYPSGYRPNPNANAFQTPRFSVNGKYMATVSSYSNRTVQFWDLDANRVLFDFDSNSQSSANSPAISQDGSRVGCFLYPGMVSVWNTLSGEEVARIKVIEKVINRWNGGIQSGQMGFSPNNKRLALSWRTYDGQTGRSTSSVAVWDLTKRKELFRIDRNSSSTQAPAFSPDGNLVILDNEKNQLAVYDASNGSKIRDLESSSSSHQNVAFSPDGRFVVATSYTSSSSTGYLAYIHVWEAATGKRRSMFHGHRGMVSSVAFSPDCRVLATGS